MKIYNSFFDKHGNEYNFENYLSFSSFWFSISRKSAISNFPDFANLQKYACNSKEARSSKK